MPTRIILGLPNGGFPQPSSTFEAYGMASEPNWRLANVTNKGQNYRMLYFFHGQVAAVVSHGLLKERVVPAKEIDVAVERKKAFEADPKRHTHEEGEESE